MFSLGGVLYHLLTGRRAFDGKTTYELVQSILATTPPPPSQLRADAPRALDEVVARAMAKSPADRYASWTEFGAAVAKLLKLDGGGARLTEAEKFAVARRLKFFERFSDAELWQALRASVWRRPPAGGALIPRGTARDPFYLLPPRQLDGAPPG